MSAPATAHESAPTPLSSPGPIEFRWVSSLQDIGREAWEACFPHDDVMQSFALHQATEAAGLEGVEFHYLVGRSARGVVAILPCFRFRTSLTTIAPEGITKAVAAVRRLFPNFLYIHAFVVGTPIAICKDLLGLHPGLGDTARADVLRAGCREVLARARELGLSLVFLKELTSSLLPSVRAALGEELTFVESPATTYLYLGEPGKSTYRERLRKKYRSLMNNRMARAEAAGLRWELCTDFAPYAARMHPLYLQVLGRSKIRFETLSVDFFEKLPRHLGDRAFAMLCFKDERLVAFELFLQDGAWMHPIYLGLDYGFRDEGALYFNCIYKIVEVLESRGRPVAQLGQTSYAVKASIGAVVDRLYLAVRHLNPVLNLLVRRLGPALFPPTQLPRSQRVFRDKKENDEGLARHGIRFERLDDGGDE